VKTIQAARMLASCTDDHQVMDALECLKNSRSFHLRCCAEKAAGKAAFLRRNQDRLVEEMMAEKLPLKAYKVQRFVNARYSNYMHSKQ
jgi:hypothetical protein